MKKEDYTEQGLIFILEKIGQMNLWLSLQYLSMSLTGSILQMGYLMRWIMLCMGIPYIEI